VCWRRTLSVHIAPSPCVPQIFPSTVAIRPFVGHTHTNSAFDLMEAGNGTCGALGSVGANPRTVELRPIQTLFDGESILEIARKFRTRNRPPQVRFSERGPVATGYVLSDGEKKTAYCVTPAIGVLVAPKSLVFWGAAGERQLYLRASVAVSILPEVRAKSRPDLPLVSSRMVEFTALQSTRGADRWLTV
jgi:hypothetical protein